MQSVFYITFTRQGAQRLTKTLPALKAGEVAIEFSAELPNSLFTTPVLRAAITVPASMVPESAISAEVQENVVAAIGQATGLTVRLVVEEKVREEGQHDV